MAALTKCWQKLRTDFTELAVTFETQLRSDYIDIQKCDENVNELCIPDVEPVARLLSIKQPDLSWLYDWEDLDVEFGLGNYMRFITQYGLFNHRVRQSVPQPSPKKCYHPSQF